MRAQELARIPTFSHLRREKEIKWQILTTPPMSGEANMHFDRQTLAAIESGDVPPTLRFFRFSEPTVSFGRLQKIEPIRPRVPPHWNVVQRPTGGGIVFHKDDLCLSFCWTRGQSPLPAQPKEIYRWIHAVILEGLGDSLRMASCDDVGTSSAPFATRECFANPAVYDLLKGSQKVVGGAIARQGDVFLYQGSIQYSNPRLAQRLRTFFPRALQAT